MRMSELISGVRSDIAIKIFGDEHVQSIGASRAQPTQFGESTDAMGSPDGRAIVYRTRQNKFVIAD
jgi:hypothetical protein